MFHGVIHKITLAQFLRHGVFPETRVIGLQSMGLTLLKFVQWAPKVASVQRLAVQGHPRSMILVPIESVYATSY